MGGRNAAEPGIVFREWSRRAGGRFLGHEETIKPGEYSDDTQLLICTARSLLRRESWLQEFIQNELPAWSIYQRGAGGATKRAAEAWASGKSPWGKFVSEEDRRRYFLAGGNGVAMRIMPHAVIAGQLESFDVLKTAILLNGISTHGHPRALLGAIVYGYVAWTALRYSHTLPYGMLVEVALEKERDWSSLPEMGLLPDDWRSFATRGLGGELETVWAQTTREMMDLLTKVHRGIQAGALAIDEDVLRRLGCFDPAVNGAGTVSAAGAIYLASKYAPDPPHGLIGAAFAKGADTDTLASMTGALLGLVGGMDWLRGTIGLLEDSELLRHLSMELQSVSYDQVECGAILGRDRRADLKQFLRNLEADDSGKRIQIPDGREGVIRNVVPIKVRSSVLSGSSWTIEADDGQTLHIKRLHRSSSTAQKQVGFKEFIPTRPRSTVQAVKVRVQDLPRARQFYGEVLGLEIARQAKNAINFGDILTLVPANYDTGFIDSNSSRSIICIETDDLDLCRERVLRVEPSRIGPNRETSRKTLFRVL